MPWIRGGATARVDTIYGQPLLMRIHQGAISACARERVLNRQWYKPNVNYTREDFARDDYQCRRENLVTSYQSGVILGTVHTIPATELDRTCQAP